MRFIKTFIGIVVIVGIIAGMGYFAYNTMQNKESIVTLDYGVEYQIKEGDIGVLTGKKGETLMLPTKDQITRDGYDFDGWYLDVAFTREYTSSTFPRGNIKLYAKWKQKTIITTLHYENAGQTTDENLINETINLQYPAQDFGYRVIWTNAYMQKSELIECLRNNNFVYDGREFDIYMDDGQAYKVTKEEDLYQYMNIPYFFNINIVYYDEDNANKEVILPKPYRWEFGERINLNDISADNYARKGYRVDLSNATLQYGNDNKTIPFMNNSSVVSSMEYSDKYELFTGLQQGNVKIICNYNLERYTITLMGYEPLSGDSLIKEYHISNIEYKSDISQFLNSDYINSIGNIRVNYHTISGNLNCEDENGGVLSVVPSAMPYYDLKVYFTYSKINYQNMLKIQTANGEINDCKAFSLTYDEELQSNDINFDKIKADKTIQVFNSQNKLVDLSDYTDDYYYIDYGNGTTSSQYPKSNIVDLLESYDVTQNYSIIIKLIQDTYYIKYYLDSGETNYITNGKEKLFSRSEVVPEYCNLVPSADLYNQCKNAKNNNILGGWTIYLNGEEKYFDETIKYPTDDITGDIIVVGDWYSIDVSSYSYAGENLNTITGCSSNFQNVALIGNNKNLTNPLYVGNGISSVLPDNTFIKKLLLPSCVVQINSWAFKNSDVQIRFLNDENVRELVIKKNAFSSGDILEMVATDRFENVKSIKTITLPARTKNIEAGAFAGALNLIKFEVASACPYYEVFDGILYNKEVEGEDYQKTLVAYPFGNTNSTFTIPDDVKIIESYAFSYSYIGAEYLNNALKFEDYFNSPIFFDKSFNNVTKSYVRTLSKIICSENSELKEIRDYSFMGAINLFVIDLSKSTKIETLGEGSFAYCFLALITDKYSYYEFKMNFEKINKVPNNFISFAYLLKRLTITNTQNINYIGSRAFTQVAFAYPKIDTTIGMGSFDNLNYELNSNIKYIGDYAFNNCRISIKIKDGFTMKRVCENCEFCDNGGNCEDCEICKVYLGKYAFSNSERIGIDTYYLEMKDERSGDRKEFVTFENVILSDAGFNKSKLNFNLQFIDCRFVNNGVSVKIFFTDCFATANDLKIQYTNDYAGGFKINYSSEFYGLTVNSLILDNVGTVYKNFLDSATLNNLYINHDLSETVITGYATELSEYTKLAIEPANGNHINIYIADGFLFSKYESDAVWSEFASYMDVGTYSNV